MSWHKEFLSENNKNKSLSDKSSLFKLIEEVYTESLTKEEKSLISEDFVQNTLFEIFSGIDYTKLSKSLNENKSLEQLLAEQEEIDVTAEEIRLGLPKLRISEDWGVPESRDRQIIEGFTRGIPGNSLEEKLARINNVATGKVQLASVGDILSTMVVLEVLSTILSQFTEAAGGFIFEGFLAGLFGEGSVQITDVEEEDEATGKPITDVKLGEKEYSLKLLNPTTAVKGSWRNMVEHFAGGRDHVVYLDARRSGSGAADSLLFSEFEITLENYIEVFYDPFKKMVPVQRQAENKEELLAALEEFGERLETVKFSSRIPNTRKTNFNLKVPAQREAFLALVQASEELPAATLSVREEDYTKSVKAKRLFGDFRQFQAVQDAIASGDKDAVIEALRRTRGYKGQAQFEFTPQQAKNIANEKEIAYVLLGEEQLKKTWLIYGDIMRKTITPVYTFLARFNDNVSKYFLGTEDGDPRKEYAMAARSDLSSLKEATDEAISAIEEREITE
jgi:hypothetical protein